MVVLKKLALMREGSLGPPTEVSLNAPVDEEEDEEEDREGAVEEDEEDEEELLSVSAVDEELSVPAVDEELSVPAVDEDDEATSAGASSFAAIHT